MILNPRELKMTADRTIRAQHHNQRQLIFVYAGVLALVSLVLALLDNLLQRQIGNTGGLAGMGMRSVLETIQTVLQLTQTILTPMWTMGYTIAIWRLVRGEEAGARTLPEGFGRFGPVLRLEILMGIVSFILASGCFYIAMFVYLMTPWSAPLMEALAPLVEDAALMEDPEALAAAMRECLAGLSMEELALPLGGVFLAVLAVLAAPMLYRFRMARFALAEEPRLGAFGALRVSALLMRGRRRKLLMLDLSFWWFYGLELMIAGVVYADVLADLAGITLPLEGEALYFAALILGLALQMGLRVWRENRVQMTYAAAYEELKGPREPEQPGKQPWSYE